MNRLGGPISLEGVYAPNIQGDFAGRLAIDSEDILDGTSNTLAIAEIAKNFAGSLNDEPQLVGWAFGAAFTGDVNEPRLQTTYSSKSLVYKINRISTPENPTPVNDKINITPFASNHGGGSQFGLADGSVRFVSQSVDEDVLKIWTSINVREKNSPDDLTGT